MTNITLRELQPKRVNFSDLAVPSFFLYNGAPYLKVTDKYSAGEPNFTPYSESLNAVMFDNCHNKMLSVHLNEDAKCLVLDDVDITFGVPPM